MDLTDKLIKLGSKNPSLRPHLRQILKYAGGASFPPLPDSIEDPIVAWTKEDRGNNRKFWDLRKEWSKNIGVGIGGAKKRALQTLMPYLRKNAPRPVVELVENDPRSFGMLINLSLLRQIKDVKVTEKGMKITGIWWTSLDLNTPYSEQALAGQFSKSARWDAFGTQPTHRAKKYLKVVPDSRYNLAFGGMGKVMDLKGMKNNELSAMVVWEGTTYLPFDRAMMDKYDEWQDEEAGKDQLWAHFDKDDAQALAKLMQRKISQDWGISPKSYVSTRGMRKSRPYVDIRVEEKLYGYDEPPVNLEVSLYGSEDNGEILYYLTNDGTYSHEEYDSDIPEAYKELSRGRLPSRQELLQGLNEILPEFMDSVVEPW